MQVISLLREKEKRKERETQVQVIKWIIVCFGVLLYASYGRVCTWERKRVSKVFIYGICVFSRRNMIFFRLFSSNSYLHFLWLCSDVDMCQSMSIMINVRMQKVLYIWRMLSCILSSSLLSPVPYACEFPSSFHFTKCVIIGRCFVSDYIYCIYVIDVYVRLTSIIYWYMYRHTMLCTWTGAINDDLKGKRGRFYFLYVYTVDSFTRPHFSW